MLVLGIIACAIEAVTFLTVYGLLQTGYPLSAGGAWFIVFVIAACVAMAIIALIGCIKRLKTYYETGKNITGIVFSGITLLQGAIFFIAFIVGALGAL